MTEPVAEQTQDFKGEKFRLNQDVSEFAFLEFAEAAQAGEDGNTLQGMASLLRFVLELVHPDERDKFRSVARRERATSADLMGFLGVKVEEDAERPTQPSVDSSPGRTDTAPKSESSSVVRVLPTSGLDLRKRPDLARFAHEARQAAG